MDIAAQAQPTRQALAIEGRSGRLKVTGKLKVALDAMVWQGLTRDQAAQHASLTIHSLREALRKGHVKAYLKEQLVVLRESEHARNVHRLAEIRDAGNNMPAVQAIGMLERMRSEADGTQSGATPFPGLTIRIVNQAPTAPLIDVSPTPVRHMGDTQDD